MWFEVFYPYNPVIDSFLSIDKNLYSVEKYASFCQTTLSSSESMNELKKQGRYLV
jgi:hypothetical protein